MAFWAALFDNIFDDLLKTQVVVLILGNPWRLPNMKLSWMAKNVACQVFICIETLIHSHVETTEHNCNEPWFCQRRKCWQPTNWLTLRLKCLLYSQNNGLEGKETRYLRVRIRGLASAPGFRLFSVYLSDSAACEQVCAVEAATDVRCCELATRLVPEWLFPS